MVTVEEAASAARRQFLAEPGVVAVGRLGNIIVFYVEKPEDAYRMPTSYMGYPTAVKVVGKITTL